MNLLVGSEEDDGQAKTSIEDLAWKALFPPSGSATADKRIFEFLKHVCVSFGFSEAHLLSLRSGVLFVEQIYPRRQSRVRAKEQDIKVWRRTERGAPAGERVVVIPIRPLSPDPLFAYRLRAMVVLSHSPTSENSSRSALAENPTLLRDFGVYVADRLDALLISGIAGAHQRLSSLQGRLVLSADMCYHVAHEIKNHLGFIGWCGVFRARGNTLESVAILQADTPREITAQLAKKIPVEIGDLSASLSGQGTIEPLAFLWNSNLTLTGIGKKKTGGIYVTRDLHKPVRMLIESIVNGIQAQSERQYDGWLICPLRWRRRNIGEQEKIGVMVIASESADISAVEAITASELSTHCVPALARDAAMESEFDILESASAVDPEVPLHNNEAFRQLLQILCESFRVHRNADIVTLIPYENRTETMRLDMLASSPPAPDIESADPQPSGAGVLRHILDAGEFEWHQANRPHFFSEDSFVVRNKILSFYAIVLKTIPEGSDSRDRPLPLGVLFVNYKTAKRGRNAEGEISDPGFTAIEQKWIRRYAAIAEKYLSVQARTAQNHNNDQAALKIYREVSQVLRAGSVSEAEAQAVELVVESTWKAIFEVAAELVGATAGVLAVPSDDGNGLRILYQKNLNPAKAHEEIPFGKGVTGICAERREAIYLRDTQDPQSWPPGVRPFEWVSGSKSEFAVPLISHDSPEYLLGVLDLENQYTTHAFGPAERSALTDLANASVLAIELTESLRILEQLAKITKKIRKAHTASAVYEILLEDASRVLHAYAGSVRVLDSDGVRLDVAARKGESGTLGENPIPVGTGVTGYVAKHRITVAISDVRDTAAIEARYGKLDYLNSHEKTRSEIAVPLLWNSRLLGILNFEHTQVATLPRFATFLEGLAHQAAQSLSVIKERSLVRFDQYGEAVETIRLMASTVRHNVTKFFNNISRLSLTAEGFQPNSEISERLTAIRQEATQGNKEALRLVNMAASLELPLRLCNPVQSLTTAVEDLKQKLPLNFQIQLFRECPQDTQIAGREDVLSWCFTEIMSNSYTYDAKLIVIRVRLTARGSVQPTIESRAADKASSRAQTLDESWLHLTFEDDGPGVSSDHYEDVFALEKEYLTPKGYGNAMYLCRIYIKHMRGVMWCSRSDDLGGLQMHIAVPLADHVRGG